MLPSECGTDGSSNTRITCAITSPSPSSASSASRGAGPLAPPTCVADAPLFPSTCAFGNIRNSVVFPTCGSPIIPVCTPALSIQYFPPAQTHHPNTPPHYAFASLCLGFCRVRHIPGGPLFALNRAVFYAPASNRTVNLLNGYPIRSRTM